MTWKYLRKIYIEKNPPNLRHENPIDVLALVFAFPFSIFDNRSRRKHKTGGPGFGGTCVPGELSKQGVDTHRLPGYMWSIYIPVRL